ncbi:hypothetical protein PanWU01x14_128000 [Parasponia andersonii]|uniref:Aspartic peptidase domain containing protein n=1 Tax=Parasponia andersonii TaxID=3476 RepID=A0A2P5CSL4_PARAD|nr:hypothetical protein PanWU01x14_128000 [Parasponia andersonii]
MAEGRVKRLRGMGHFVNHLMMGESRTSAAPVVFTQQDLTTVHLPHDEPLVIKLQIGSALVERVLVDGGSSVDILFLSTFENMNLLLFFMCSRTPDFVGPWSGEGLFTPCGAGVYTSVIVIAAEVLSAFWWLSSTLNTLSDFAWTSAISYRRFKRRWFDSIDPSCRLLTNELAAWTESAFWTRDITSRKRDKYFYRDSSVVCSNRSRSRMVFCCLRTPVYCFRKSLQKSSNPFMDLSGSCLNHSRAGPARVIEKTLQLSLERLEGWGREVPRPGLHLDPVSEGHLVDPSYSLLCQIIGVLAVMGPESLT